MAIVFLCKDSSQTFTECSVKVACFTLEVTNRNGESCLHWKQSQLLVHNLIQGQQGKLWSQEKKQTAAKSAV